MTQVKKFWPILTATHRYDKALASESGAELWPNHDIHFFRARNRFPDFFE